MKQVSKELFIENDRNKLGLLELLLRVVMIAILATAGISKLMSHHGFHKYYYGLFLNNELRIQIPPLLIQYYLEVIPFVEIGIAVGLCFAARKQFFIACWLLFFTSIQLGHYVLQEWSAVNEIVPYYLLGAIVYVLPAFSRKKNKVKEAN